MLNQEIKRKINSARDILMDEIPNLQEQVNQITIALIYKFMDAIDRQNIKIGLQPQFFIKDLKNLSWTNLLNPTLSEQERFDLYAQNISQISKNPNIPQLFRDIFKEMFLPCNDTRILNLFLKEIDSFSCEHSENLGDAYEYLLNILGASGHTGHFLAPRHIIDFIVDVVAPQKSETILDPACGTADFLISAFKYIVKNNNLTQTDSTELLKNVTGYDIAPDMVKLSLVNMYLHNFPEPKIYAYDILTSEDRWNDNFDVILSIPPFMTPKGGISPHKRFAIQATRSEVLFIDYIMEHLNIKGRAGIIVPEGIIFQSANVYKTLHKKLIEEGLFAIASLPSGVFNPYSGIKTSILFIDKQFAKKSNEILFLRLENDGFDLGMQRRQIDKNDLPQALKIIEEWKSSLTILTKAEIQVSAVTKEDIAKDDYNLTASHYVVGKNFENCKYELVRLDDICKFNLGESIMKKDIVKGNIPIISSGQAPTYYHNKSNRNGETIAISSSGANAGFISYWNTPIFLSDSFSITPKDDRLNTSFLYQVLKSQQNKIHALQLGVSIPHISWKDMADLQIPLPPLEVQKKIVEEIENKQSAINHAGEIIKNLEKERKYFT
ncbi:MAG: N-6 DNA methylase, partial [Endomicrobium sp.]|nr:N-6 DNA methylase [Endomicrobium sp.]